MFAAAFAGKPNELRSGSSLFGARSSPGAWTYANDTGEHSRQVALICKAAAQGYIQQGQSTVAQLLLRSVDAARE
jgi:hypothetical protein